MTDEKKIYNGTICLRQPQVDDARLVHALVDRAKPLDLNSLYCYLLLCDHYAQTCIVAERESVIVGFISSYIIPGKEDVLFVWQVAVDDSARKQGLASAMIKELLSRDCMKNITYIETTVTPSNGPSAGFFHNLAKTLQTGCEHIPYYSKEQLGSGDHEEEVLFRIGPFQL